MDGLSAVFRIIPVKILTLDELEELLDRGIDVRKIVDELEL